MLYPAYVHPGDADHAFCIQFPDLPGCCSAADSASDIDRCAQAAFEAHFADGGSIPVPKSIGLRLTDPAYRDGFWMLINIDVAKVSKKAVRVNISLPENLVQKIDAVADARRMTRSAFLALAAEHEMEKA